MIELQKFYSDENMRKAVFDYFKAKLDDYALKQIYLGVDTSGIKHTKDLLDKIINDLGKEYGKEKPKPEVNRAV